MLPVVFPPAGVCADGWQLATGSVYDAWPPPGSPDGVTYSGLFSGISPTRDCSGPGEVFVTTGVCDPPGLCTPVTYDPSVGCRFGDHIVARLSIVSVNYPGSYTGLHFLDGKKLRIYSPSNPDRVIFVNAVDSCSDCGNTGTSIALSLEKHAAKALYNAPDVVNNITYDFKGGVATATFSNPTGTLYDVNAGTDMSGDLCFQVSDVPALWNGVPIDEVGNPITLKDDSTPITKASCNPFLLRTNNLPPPPGEHDSQPNPGCRTLQCDDVVKGLWWMLILTWLDGRTRHAQQQPPAFLHNSSSPGQCFTHSPGMTHYCPS